MQDYKIGTVSIIIPTFNSEQYICETIECCLNQTYKNIEIIIVDDGSTDNTRTLLKGYFKNKLIKYIYQENKGRSVARNTGLKIACGEFIQFLDSDDLLKSNKLEKQVNILNKHLDIFGVYCSTQYFKNTISNIIYKRRAHIQGNIYLELLNGNFIPIHSMLIRRADIFFDEYISTCEDWDYWLRLCTSEKKFLSMNETLCYVRIHVNNTSINSEKMIKGKIYVINKLLQVMPNNGNLLLKKFELLYYINKFEALTYLKHLANVKNKYLIKGLIFIIIKEIKSTLNKILKINRNIYK